MSLQPTLPPVTGLAAKTGLELLTAATPNGHKVSIMLEEMKAAYGLEYSTQAVTLRKRDQKEPWYITLNPNGKIPLLVDHDNDDFAIFESAVILLYIVRTYDKSYKFHFADPKLETTSECWVSFSSSELGASIVQSIHYYRFATERHAYPVQRAVGELERLLGVLDSALSGRDYLVGPGRGMFSVADIANWAFVNSAGFCGTDAGLDRWDNLKAWWTRIWERPAVKRGVAIPFSVGADNESYMKKVQEVPEYASSEEVLRKALQEARTKFSYVYKSP